MLTEPERPMDQQAVQLEATLKERLRAILGEDGAVFGEAEVELASRTCIPYRNIPSAVVYPATTEQVRDVIVAAREFDVPVWPVSTGRNWGYGEKAACYPDGITMVLERMTRILHVDEELAYAVIEPGVTYQQLNDYLKRTGSRLWADTAGSTPRASVIGNALDKGRGLTPYADHFGHLCGMDVVLPDGRLLETGGGPAGNNAVRHTYKWGVGPYLDGLFGQSNLGVVVKAGVWLMPAPEKFDFAAFEYTASADQLPAFLDDLRTLVQAGAIRSHPHLANDFAMMCILSQYPHELLEGRRHLSEAAAATWRKRYGVASWTFGCGLYGGREEVRYQKRMIKRVLGKYGLIRFVGAAIRDDLAGRAVRFLAPIANRLLGKAQGFVDSMVPAINLFRGIPTDFFVRQAYFKSHAEKPTGDVDPARDKCGFVWIGPVVPFTAEHIMRALALTRPVFEQYEFDFFVEVIIESPRSVIVLVGVFFDREDAADAARARDWYEAARRVYLDHGYPPYRATAMSMPHALDDNPVARDLLHSIKHAVDPANIVAPGRYGMPARD